MRKYPPGMTYEEIASSRSHRTDRKETEVKVDDEFSPDRDSVESIEPLQEKDIKATGPDPYEKLNYKAGEKNDFQHTQIRFYIKVIAIIEVNRDYCRK